MSWDLSSSQGHWIQDVMERLSLVFWLLRFAYIYMVTKDSAKGNPERYQEWLKNSEGKGEGRECRAHNLGAYPSERETDSGRSECIWLLLKVGLWLLWPLSCPWGTRTAEPESGSVWQSKMGVSFPIVLLTCEEGFKLGMLGCPQIFLSSEEKTWEAIKKYLRGTWWERFFPLTLWRQHKWGLYTAADLWPHWDSGNLVG